MYFVYTIFVFLYTFFIISVYFYTYSERTLTMPRAVYIGENLERLRLRAALSQIELAEKAEVTPAAVNRIERNRVEPQMRTVRKLAKALEVEPHVLIEGP
jgi:transcriptional regulator with XRE-family HTH domain